MYSFDSISFAFFDIFSFLNIEELNKLKIKKINHELDNIVKLNINSYKKSNIIYKILLKPKNIDILDSKIYFFKNEVITNKYKNFKSFLFELIKRNNYKSFFLSSVRYRLHYVIAINEENLLVLCDDNMGNIYYNGFYLNYRTIIPYTNDHDEKLCGYVYKNNLLNDKNKKLLNYIC